METKVGWRLAREQVQKRKRAYPGETVAKLHRLIGVLFLVMFVLTGRYMDMRLAHLHGMADGPRALYRSGHIYLLFAALLNIVAGTNMALSRGNARLAQYAASTLILATPFLFTYGFFAETPLAIVERPVTRLAIYASLLGVVVFAFAATLSDGVDSSVISPAHPDEPEQPTHT